ncbi:MAG: RnfABCDGE type electron transport complex subunit G [Salinivirgaceae bacterium]|nr:RnfABCDGE type electron transport complex subunit G [Salinivirgaceae bacterium]
MATRESDFKNMLMTLLVITFVASAALALVYNVTKEPIALVQIENKNASIQMVLPVFDNQPFAEQFKIASDGDSLVCYPAKNNDELVGVAIETYSKKGYSGLISIMVGFKPDGTIINYSVIEHKETPGLGTKMGEWFKTEKNNQSVLGKNPGTFKLKVKKDGGEVDAITAATISSRAFCEGIQRAYQAYIKSNPQNQTTEVTQ